MNGLASLQSQLLPFYGALLRAFPRRRCADATPFLYRPPRGTAGGTSVRCILRVIPTRPFWDGSRFL